MTETSVFQLSQSGRFSHPLIEELRDGACARLAQAVEADVAAFLDGHADAPADASCTTVNCPSARS